MLSTQGHLQWCELYGEADCWSFEFRDKHIMSSLVNQHSGFTLNETTSWRDSWRSMAWQEALFLLQHS